MFQKSENVFSMSCENFTQISLFNNENLATLLSTKKQILENGLFGLKESKDKVLSKKNNSKVDLQNSTELLNYQSID